MRHGGTLGAALVAAFLAFAPGIHAEAPAASLAEAQKSAARAGALLQQGKFDDALPLAERALSIREKLLGPDHADVADAATTLANILFAKGDFGRAATAYGKALSILERTLGAGDPRVARALYYSGRTSNRNGDYPGAEALLKRALDIYEKASQGESDAAADAMNSLANDYVDEGEFAKAEPVYRRALAIKERLLGPDDPAVGHVLCNLASLYDDRGEYAQAEPLYLRALALEEKALGPDDPHVAGTVLDLGVLYFNRGEFPRAEGFFERAAAIRRKALGPFHPDVAMVLNNQAETARRMHDYPRARAIFEEAVSIWEKALGKDHPSLAFSLSGLAQTCEEQGDLEHAELYMKRALDIRVRALGDGHPDVAQTYLQLANFEEAKGDYASAVADREKGNDVRERALVRVLWAGSEDQKRTFLALSSSETELAVAFALRTGRPEAARVALTALLRRKGRLLDAMTESLTAVRRGLDREGKELLGELEKVRAELSSQTLAGPGDEGVDAHRQTLARLAAKESDLEGAISARSGQFRRAEQPITVNVLQAKLPERAALVEWFVYRPPPPGRPYDDPSEAPRLAAAVLERAGDPTWIDLGEVSAIDARIATLRTALANPASDPKPAARALEATVFAPVRARLGATRWVLLSPDGLLDLVPFDALVDEGGHYLVDGWAFSYLTSGRDLLRLESPAAPRSGPVVIGDPSFGVSGAPSAEGARSAQRSIDMARVHFTELPGAVREVKAVAAELPGSVLLVRDDATESAVKALQGPSILHVATHGFFLPPQPEPGPGATGRGAIENPLLRSGIALAGANTHRRDGEDGILTALEASSLDLDGTKLVTLSACETGLGDATGGEGVYGLRRALVLAGAESQVMSLWKVEDDATRELMAAYYARLAAGEGRASALRAVELEVREKHAHPYYWAAFLLSGAWSSFDGKSSPPDFAKVAPARGCACEVPRSSSEGGVREWEWEWEWEWVVVCAIFFGASVGRRRWS